MTTAGLIWKSLCPDVRVEKKIGGNSFFVSTKYHAPYLFYGDAFDAEDVPLPSSGHVWDLGCNIGLYAVKAARLGCRVTAFDISKNNIECLRWTAERNHLEIKAVHCPVTVKQIRWGDTGGHTEDVLVAGHDVSLTYLEAAARYGTPSFIKMDIQGSELEFLKSAEFRAWVHDLGIVLYLETHGDAADHVWPELRQIGPIHYTT